MTDIKTLNSKFGIDEQLVFKSGPGNLSIAEINNAHATASIALHGAHVMSYQPQGQRDVLWVSEQSQYKPGKAIRGGIPVCWPWFANHPTDPGKPAHGIARTRVWSVTGSEVVDGDAVRVSFSLSDTDDTRALWPPAFRLELIATVGPKLQVELLVHNPGSEPFSCTGALHTYFNVSDIDNVRIHGLEHTPYIDKVDDDQKKMQKGEIVVASEVDRIYLDTRADCLIEDAGWQRRILVSKSGSRTTVVWNPWTDKAQQMGDFGDEEYHRMVCVETTNAADDVITVPPGGTHRLAAIISAG